MKEKKARVEDALHAARAAVEEGILPGGGVAVIRAAAKVLDKVAKRRAPNDDQRVGVEIVRRAVEAPIKQIAENAGVDGSVVAQKIKEKLDDVNFGYNALTHEYGDLIKSGVIVPTKVERIALENAASIASLAAHDRSRHQRHQGRQTRDGRRRRRWHGRNGRHGRRHAGHVLIQSACRRMQRTFAIE